LAAWNAIPPNRPKVLSTFLGKLNPKEGVLYLLKRDISGNAENFWGWLDSNTVVFTSRNSDGSYYIYLYELS
jgi:hypothetical protein